MRCLQISSATTHGDSGLVVTVGIKVEARVKGEARAKVEARVREEGRAKAKGKRVTKAKRVTKGAMEGEIVAKRGRAKGAMAATSAHRLQSGRPGGCL